MRSRLTGSLVGEGRPPAAAAAEAAHLSQSQSARSAGVVPHFVRLDFAYATRTVLFVMAGVMAGAFLVALLGLRAGLQDEPEPDPAKVAAA